MNKSIDLSFLKQEVSWKDLAALLQENFGFDEQRKFDHFVQFRRAGLVVNFYQTGRLLFQGNVQNAEVLSFLQTLFKVLRDEKRFFQKYQHCIGADEAGKGEKTGGLVVTAYYCSYEDLPYLIGLGISDSKRIGLEKLRELAAELMRYRSGVLEGKKPYVIKELSPADFNELWRKLGNVNIVLETLYEQALNSIVTQVGFREGTIFVDKFSSMENRFISKLSILRSNSQRIRLVLEPKAEKYPPVAAASIIAKYRYESTKHNFRVYKDYT